MTYLFIGANCPNRIQARTRDRPLSRGDVTLRQAVTFLGAQLTVGLGVLTQLNWYRCVVRSLLCQ